MWVGSLELPNEWRNLQLILFRLVVQLPQTIFCCCRIQPARYLTSTLKIGHHWLKDNFHFTSKIWSNSLGNFLKVGHYLFHKMSFLFIFFLLFFYPTYVNVVNPLTVNSNCYFFSFKLEAILPVSITPLFW